MDDIYKDKRFTKFLKDPRYRQISKKERKVKIDKRFHSMFDNEKFKIKYTVDKRGRPIQQTSEENLKKYYELSEESDSEDEESENEQKDEPSIPGQYVLKKKSSDGKERDKDDGKESDEEDGKESDKEDAKASDKDDDDEEKPDDRNESEVKNDSLERGVIDKEVKKKLRDLDIDYARGEGNLYSEDSSSDEGPSEEEEEDEVEHAWGELDADADTTDDATHRLAICNMDWDNIKALDLFVLFNSFLPPGGVTNSVTIYPSEYGQKRLQEEELRGPIELTETKKEDGSDDEDNEEGSKYHMEKLRLYQLNRLKYYYAIAVFDSANTANKIYTDCDGIEYESSATKLDLRFVPDDVAFDQEVHDECTELPDSNRYKPRLFTTTALQQAKVELTWDTADPHRTHALRSAAQGDIQSQDLREYLACSSEEESEVEDDTKDKVSGEDESAEVDPISKYKSLLQEIEEGERKKRDRGVEMEISWGMGLKEKTEELVNNKINKGDKLTPFEELIEKKKEKKKAKKLERRKKIEAANKGSDESEGENAGYSSDDIPSDVDMNDPYFAEEFKDPEFQKHKKTKSKGKSKKVTEKSKDGSDEESQRKRAELELLLDDEDDGKQHFSLKKIQDAENETKSKKKRKMKKESDAKNDNKVDDFEIDTKDQRFSALFTSHHYNIDPTDPNFKKTKNMDKLIQEKLKRRPREDVGEVEVVSKKSKADASMSVLVKSIKRKTQNLNR